MEATGDHRRLAPYVPRTVLDTLPPDPGAPLPRSAPVRAAILISDIEGSTPLMSVLTVAGPKGLDALQLFLRQYYGAMIEAIDRYGGVIFQFAGDAILTCFEARAGEDDGALASRALACAQELRARAGRLVSLRFDDQQLEVRCKFGLGFGDCHRLLLGEEELWIHPLLVGPALDEAVGAEKAAKGGDLLISEALAAALPRPVLAETRGSFKRVHEGPPVLPLPAPSSMPPLSDGALEQARRFVPPQLAHLILAGHEGFLADIREITALFLRFELSTPYGQSGALPERVGDVNRFFAAVQRDAETFGGWLSQTDFTDKGNVLFVIFGAPNALERRESIAARFAWKLLQERERFPFVRKLQIGLATGTACCGNVGSASRVGYTTIGEVANVAARLMGVGDSSAVHVDEATARKLTRDFGLTRVEGVTLKGLAGRLPVFRMHTPSSLEGDIQDTAPRGALVGRRAELGQLRELLEGLSTEGGQVALVWGEAGIGKTSIAARLRDEARALGYATLVGSCVSFEQFTPFFPWKEPLSAALGVHPADPRDRPIPRIQQVLGEIEDIGADWTPVLAGVLGVVVEELPLTRNLDARSKHRRLFDIVVRLIERAARQRPLLLLFEDVHWADTISAELIQHVAVAIERLPVLLLLTARPGERLQRLHTLPKFVDIPLVSLAAPEATQLLRARLPLDLPNLGLEQLVLSRAQGNPFFIETIVRGLVERFGRGRLGGTISIPEDLAEITIPDSIQDVMLGRIDRLEPADQALVKAASVIGRVFALDDVMPLLMPDLGEAEARGSIHRLIELGMLDVESRDPMVLAFHHVLIQNVAYNAQLLSRRSELHGRLARALERRNEGRAGLLAFHFLAANEPKKGLEYTLLAARSASEQYANRDAVHHFQKALEILSSPEFAADPGSARLTHQVKRELAQTLLQEGSYPEAIRLLEAALSEAKTREEKSDIYESFGRIYSDTGEPALAISALETSLRLHGRRTPRSLPGLGLAIVAQALVLLLPIRRGRDEKVERQVAQLGTLISMIRIYYFVDVGKLVWATLLALYLGPRTGSDYGNSLARTYLSTLLSAAFFLDRARVEAERGLVLARKAGDPVAEATAISRLGNAATFSNQLEAGVAYANEAIRIFRHVGEMWEILTAVMLRAVTQFLKGEFDPAHRSFLEMATMSRVLNARRHIAWSQGWAPMCRYLLGRSEADAVRRELEDSLATSMQMEDQANITTANNHLANIAVREEDVEGAARAAVQCFDAVWAYHVMVPFCQKGLIDAAEAALFALERGAVSVRRGKLKRIVRLGLWKATMIGRFYTHLRGQALRIKARDLRLRKGVAAAEPVFDEALAVLAAGPNPWEHGVALFDASEALPHRREALRAEARALFERHGLVGELRRLERAG